MNASQKSVMIVAAEASSALFAQRLLEHWKKNQFQIEAFGVGTVEMEELGFHRIGKSEDMAIVGAVEIITHYGLLRSVFNGLVEAAREKRPNVVILMDYPEFNLMLSKKLHQMGIPAVYYISPQVWAWRQGRVKTIKKYCDKVFLLFPFEVPFYEQHQVPNEFVGHPLLDEMDPDLLNPEMTKLRRQQKGIADQEIVIGLMPGSRRVELKNHFEIQLKVAENLWKKHPHIKILIMIAPTRKKEDLLPYLEDFRVPYMMLKDEPFKMIQLCDYILAASGTATLMVGLLHKPMIIMYRMSPLTALLAKLIVKGFFGLVNLISGKKIVPEIFQEQANVENLTAEMSKLIEDQDYANQMRKDLAQLQSKLGQKGATARVAKALEQYFQ